MRIGVSCKEKKVSKLSALQSLGLGTLTNYVNTNTKAKEIAASNFSEHYSKVEANQIVPD
jgi:hypothetical protein